MDYKEFYIDLNVGKEKAFKTIIAFYEACGKKLSESTENWFKNKFDSKGKVKKSFNAYATFYTSYGDDINCKMVQDKPSHLKEFKLSSKKPFIIGGVLAIGALAYWKFR